MLKPTVFISYKCAHEPTAEAIRRLEAALSTGSFDVLRDVGMSASVRLRSCVERPKRALSTIVRL